MAGRGCAQTPEIINEEGEEAQNEMEVLGEEVRASESCL